MLPKDLLVVWKRKPKIKPQYLKEKELAERVLRVYYESQGKKYKQLQRNLKNEEEFDNFKVLRGLATLVERRAQFISPSSLKAKNVRSFLFNQGPVLKNKERNEVLAQAAKHFDVPQKEVEEGMWSDLEQEQILKDFQSIEPWQLVEKYNLSLTQTLLFNALELNFKIKGNYQEVFRRIKYLGLMYEIQKLDHQILEKDQENQDVYEEKVKVTGPSSLFKKTRKYGTSLAKLLPAIFNAKKWEIHAKIETKVGGEPRIYNFDLSWRDDVIFPTSDFANKQPKEHFDSSVEKEFYRRFQGLKTGWQIKREPGMVKAGDYVIIPDFGFYKSKGKQEQIQDEKENYLEHYLEIVGFWTPGYLEKKIKKMQKAETEITAAVKEDLKCSKKDFPGNVIFYNRRVPLKPIVKILNQIEEEQKKKDLNQLDSQQLRLSKDVISLKQKAQDLGITTEALEEILSSRNDYEVVGGKIISQELLQEISQNDFSGNFVNAREILEEYNLPVAILDYLGYEVKWKTLNPEDATVNKKS